MGCKPLRFGFRLSEVSRYQESTAGKSKTPSEFGWREVQCEAEPRFSARPLVSRYKDVTPKCHPGRPGNSPRPQCRPRRRFSLLRKRSDVIDSKWSGREDLNLRPPGPEPVFQSFENREGWKRFGMRDLCMSASASLKPPRICRPQFRPHSSCLLKQIDRVSSCHPPGCLLLMSARNLRSSAD